MRLDQVKPGDRIRANVRGREFDATVVAKEPGRVQVDPPPTVSYFHLTARQVREKLV